MHPGRSPWHEIRHCRRPCAQLRPAPLRLMLQTLAIDGRRAAVKRIRKVGGALPGSIGRHVRLSALTAGQYLRPHRRVLAKRRRGALLVVNLPEPLMIPADGPGVDRRTLQDGFAISVRVLRQAG